MRNVLDYFVDGREKFQRIRDELIGTAFETDYEYSRIKSKMNSIRQRLKRALKDNKSEEVIHYTLFRKTFDIECGEITTSLEGKREKFVRNGKPYKR